MALSSEELTLINLVKLVSQADRMVVRMETGQLRISGSRGDLTMPDSGSPARVSQENEAVGAELPAPDHGADRSDDVVAAEGEMTIRAPIAGIFYSRPEPGAAPFCEVGTTISPDDTVCIIEVMKLFNSIPARHSGRVRRILQSDGDSVQVGDPLFILEAD